MKKVVEFLAGILLVLSLAGIANASTMTLDSSSGNWTGATTYDAYSALLVDNTSTPGEIRWGMPDGAEQSGLGFNGVTSSSFDIGGAFKVGTLTHFNNPIYSGSEATEAFLTIALDFSVPELDPILFNFTFAVDETENLGDPVGDSDIITFPSSYATETFIIDHVSYTLKLLGFGQDAYNFDPSFISPENSDDNVTSLWGEITQNPVPEPATMLLFGIGLLGISGIGRKKSFKI